ncbi:RHS repeat-associated core domain-containing protein [Vibrio ruber]|uniref:RHS repeat-associated core domain-containing protein n=1 Tax=Vibrio ruber TaxID=184755 RepID=UPI0028935998|nr:RHS repeat-associated core domain-containing protein [Vibrio ruber]WNJ95105.1 RHS repeat-associated core domain-containing protein [Vibrio ruber]
MTSEGADNATPYFYHLDQIGTPLEITDATGAVAWSVDYHSYGNVAYQRKAEIVSPLRFQGQYYDAETGLHYNRHRYYSPSTGRFITPDPIGLAGGLNNYQYVKNPTGWIDPLGLSQCKGECPGSKNSGNSSSPEPEMPQVQKDSLDWDSVVPTKGKYKGQSRPDHVRLHNIDNPNKPSHGVFYGDGVDITNQAWSKALQEGLSPDVQGSLFVPMNKLVGRAGGQAADTGELFYGVHIKLVPNSNKIITAYPGN